MRCGGGKPPGKGAMTENGAARMKRPIQMAEIYGGRISRWPHGQLRGWIAWLTSPAFRQALAAERHLDRALDLAAPEGGQPERFEARLLAAIGVAAAPERRQRVQPFGIGGLAVASLCLGVMIGALYGGEALDSSGFAGLSDDAWAEVAALDGLDGEQG